MALPLIPLLLGLAEVVPAVTGLFAGDKAQEKAEALAGMVKAVAGQEDLGAAVAAVRGRPELALQLQGLVMQHEREAFIAETARLEVVNQTMRAEALSGDAYTRRWRPTFGYVACLTWGVQGIVVFGVLGYVAIAHPERLADAARAMTDLMRALAEHWLYALAVLGVAVWKRSEDKKGAAQGPGLLGALAERIRGKGAP